MSGLASPPWPGNMMPNPNAMGCAPTRSSSMDVFPFLSHILL